jgi:hypothetical protein
MIEISIQYRNRLDQVAIHAINLGSLAASLPALDGAQDSPLQAKR